MHTQTHKHTTCFIIPTVGTQDDTINTSPPVAENSYDRSSPDVQQDSSPSPHDNTEDAQYAVTRKRRLLLMDDSDNEEAN